MHSREETEPDRQATQYNSNGHPSLEISRKDAVVTVEGCPCGRASTRIINEMTRFIRKPTLELRPAGLENPT